MRRIATLPHDQAERLADYLLTQGIETRLDPDPQASPPQADLWVCDENRLNDARTQLEQFQREPEAPRYKQARSQAQSIRQSQDRAEQTYQQNTTAFRERMLHLGTLPPTFFTWTLVTVCVFVFVMMISDEQRRDQIVKLFVIESDRPRPWQDLPNAPLADPYRPVIPAALRRQPPDLEEAHGHLQALQEAFTQRKIVWVPLAYLPDVRSGEVWRLLTPMLLHFGFAHLLFNMMGLIYLGAPLESRYGTGRYLLLILSLSLVSNLAQYFLGKGIAWESGQLLFPTSTHFGGMSGVVYGLFGFLWFKSRYRPESNFRLPPTVVLISVAWFLLCWTGAAGPIANVAHTAGLALGWLLGMLPDGRSRG